MADKVARMKWRTANNNRRRMAKRELKRARLARLRPWQRQLIAAFERLSKACGVATLHFRAFGRAADAMQIKSMDDRAADEVLRDTLQKGQPIRLTIP